MAEVDANAPPPLAPAPLAPGQLIGERYLVGPMLGGGGMGLVFAGTHVVLGTPVAIKLIHSELKDDPEAVQRFLNEARTTAALKGEHIARVFDAGVLSSGQPYLVMERLEGMALDLYLEQRGPLEQQEAVDVVLQACQGLAEAHAAALVHRDVKPANLFLTRRSDGHISVKILDFGIVKQQRHDQPGLTDPGKSLGSPWYMSPEQMLAAHTVDERADVWSLGVLLFELLTHRRPFEGENVAQVCVSVLTTTPPSPRSLREDVPRELDQIVLRCLEKEPDRRFRSVDHLATALLPFASASEQPTLRPMVSYSTGSYERSNRWPPLPTLIVLTVILVGWLQYRDPTMLPRFFTAAQVVTGQIRLPWDPQLRPGPPTPELWRASEPFAEPKTLRGARAVPETASAPAIAGREPLLTPEEARQRVERYEAWLRAQGLERLHGR